MKTYHGATSTYSDIKKGFIKEALASVIVFAVVFGAFLYGISRTSEASIEEQRTILENAIQKDIISCYVTEGRYPSSIDYLEDNYGLSYDHDMFRIDYSVLGTNLMPSYEVVEVKQ